MHFVVEKSKREGRLSRFAVEKSQWEGRLSRFAVEKSQRRGWLSRFAVEKGGGGRILSPRSWRPPRPLARIFAELPTGGIYPKNEKSRLIRQGNVQSSVKKRLPMRADVGAFRYTFS